MEIGNHPEPFGLFFLTASALFVLGLWALGRKWHEDPLEWALLLAVVVVGGHVGSKLYMLTGAHWQDVVSGHGFPGTTGKNLLGGVLGGTLACIGVRALLRSRSRILDAVAAMLPLSLLVGRPGCLLSGCCHGTQTDMPWAVIYSRGSHAFAHQVAGGVISALADRAASIHPWPLYEVLFLLVLVPLLFWLAPRLKRRDSGLYLMAGSYSLGRLALEFLRHGPVAVWGMKPVQWGLALAFVATMIVLYRRERRPSRSSVQLPSSRLLQVALPLVPVLAVAIWWFSPLERAAALLGCAPLVGHLAQRAVGWLRTRTGLRLPQPAMAGMALTGLVALTPAAMPTGDKAESNSVVVRLGGTGGQESYVHDDCVNHEKTYFVDRFATGHLDAAYKVPYHQGGFLESGRDAHSHFQVGLMGVLGQVGRIRGPGAGIPSTSGSDYEYMPGVDLYGPAPRTFFGLEPYLEADLWWAAFALGGHLNGRLKNGPLYWSPAGYLRLGPLEYFFVDASVFHRLDSYGANPFRFGLGFSIGELGYVRTGWGFGGCTSNRC